MPPPPAAQTTPDEAPPPAATSDEERRRQAATQNPEAPMQTQPSGMPMATQPAPAPQNPSEAPVTPLVGADHKEPRDHFSGIFVAAVGGVVVVLGIFLGGVAAALSFVDAIPFPGGKTERTGFATSAIVGAVFCALVGTALAVVGAALVGVSFL